MAVLESCPKHNMAAYLEKTDGNAEFHEIINFLARSSIHNALTVSPVVSTTFVEQFWMSAKSKIINNVRYITAKVAGKPVSISEASIRSDLLFDDADGIDSLPNQAIFDAIQLMGYEGDLTVLTFNKALHLDAKKKFVMYPRFISVFLDTQLKSVPVPLDHFPVNALTSKVFSFMVKKGKHFSGKVTPLFSNMLVQPTEDEGEQSERPSEPQLTPSPPHPSEVHVEPQSDPSPRPSPTTHIPDSIPESSGGNHGGQSSSDKSLSGNEGDMTLQSVYDLCISFSPHPKLLPACTVDQTKGRSATPTTLTPTLITFGDDETIAQVLLNMSQAKAVSREKEKGVKLKDVENIERPRPTSTRSLLTLKPFPKIDPKDKGKKKIEEDESDTESEAEEEVKKLAEEEAIKAALSNEYDFIQARIEADRLLALRLQDEEREQFTMEERAKFLHDTIAAQRRFLAEQRAAAIRNRPPTRTQLRSQMMTYLKHVGNKKHSDLKNKTFEEIQALYEKVKRFDESFTVIGSNEDERKIKEMNEGASDPDKKKKFVKEDVLTKVPAKPDVAEQGTKKRKGGHMKMLARKRKRPQPDVDSDDEHRKCLKIVTFEGTIDSEIMERKSVIARLNKVSSPDGDYLVIYRANGNFRAFNYLLEVLHIFDRQDLFHLYDLVMKQYSEVTLEGIELILWGDLKIMMESSTEENDQSDFWNNQQNFAFCVIYKKS
ncbi:hypothetical protein Tco_0535402 [Tanacetum coccineum]